MTVLIIYMSYHRMSTEKVAKAMAEVMNATLKKVDEVNPDDLAGYDLIGFGSGIYGGKHHKTLFTLIEKLPRMEKSVFIFSTSGGVKEQSDEPIKAALTGKGFRIVGEFRCPGVFGPMWFSLVNRGHPDANDLEKAREFARGLV